MEDSEDRSEEAAGEGFCWASDTDVLS
jgi:hypothetical protein